MTEVARTLTPITPEAAAALLVPALQSLDPMTTRESASFIFALMLNETARGEKLNNHNWGNITGEYQGSYFRPAWYTVDAGSSAQLKALHAEMVAGRAPSKFRAYPSHADGLRDYVRLLYSRFPSVVNAAKTGNPFAFAEAIYTSKYCPDEGCRPEKMHRSYAALAEFAVKQEAIGVLPKAGSSPAAPSSSDSPPSVSSESSAWYVGLAANVHLPTLQQGSKGAAVALWQKLAKIVPADGRFGPLTERATIAWQKAHTAAGMPLVIDGKVGEMTWLSLIEST